MSQPVSGRDRQRQYRERRKAELQRLGQTEFKVSIQIGQDEAAITRAWAAHQDIDVGRMLTAFLSKVVADRTQLWKELMREGQTP